MILTEEDVRKLLTKKIKDLGIGTGAWCRQNDLDPTSISNVFHGRIRPTKKLLAVLGLRKVVSYERIPRR